MKQTINQGRYLFPVKGCLFFGFPHNGAEFADRAFAFLNVLSFVFDVNKSNIKDLKSKSQRFANISSEFRAIQTEQEFPVMSFFETVKYKHHGVVSRSSTLRSQKQRWKLQYHFFMLRFQLKRCSRLSLFLVTFTACLGLMAKIVKTSFQALYARQPAPPIPLLSDGSLT